VTDAPEKHTDPEYRRVTEDAITREVVASSLISVAKEMSKALRRSAYSAIIYDMLDYSCALFGPKGELISQDENLPAQLGVMSSAIVWMLRKFAPESIAPGDIFIMNDPYLGATHTLDLIIVTPVFVDGRLMAFAGTNAHHMDVGGKSVATEAADNREIYQEGLILPIVKLYEAGVPNQAVLDIMEANVRIPKETLGDVRAQIAACRTAERRWADLCRRYGADEMRAYVEALWDYTERRVVQEIGTMSPGVYEAEGFMDPDFYGTEPLRLQVEVTVTDERFSADFAGTDAQVKGSLNCPLASTVAAVWYAIRCYIDPEVPQNEGFYRAITTTVPKGSLLNPLPPAAVSVRHLTAQKVADLVIRALRGAKPSRTAAGTSIAFPTFNLGGIDHRTGERYLCADIVGGGMGAHRSGDGISGVDTHMGNCAMMSAEAMEVEFPLRVLSTELMADSGGAGKYRGGLAIERRYELLAPKALMGGHYADQTLEKTRPWGLEGGSPGRPAAVQLNPGRPEARSMRGKEVDYEIAQGDVLVLRSSGGGGWGPPAARDREALASDVHDGYVTTEGALADYGIEIGMEDT
jgi:N-methylhydantoinase B